MPERRARNRALKDAREGKAPTTQAGEFVGEEIEHVRAGKHGARSTKQLIAIGLAKARRAGVKLPPRKGTATAAKTARDGAGRENQKGLRSAKKAPSRKRSRSATVALKREGTQAASGRALSRQAHSSARKRRAAEQPRSE